IKVMKLFIRTDKEVIKDALKLTRPSFVEKYKDTCASKKTLEEAYHQLRVYHVEKGSANTLSPYLDKILGEDVNDTIVVEDQDQTRVDDSYTKLTIQKREEEE